MKTKLKELMLKNTEVRKDGFSIRIKNETDLWHECFQALGVHQAYELMASILNELYLQKYAEEFLFSDECMAFEIAYHADAYMDVMGYKGYHPHLTTHLFSDDELKSHCEVIDISTVDINNMKQAVMFGYKKGIRDCYKNSDKNPYHKK